MQFYCHYLEAIRLTVISPISCALNFRFVTSNQRLRNFRASGRQMVYGVRVTQRYRCITLVSVWHSMVFYLN